MAQELGQTDLFHYHVPRLVPVLCGALVLASGLDMLRESTSASGVFFTLFGPYLVLRALRATAVVVDQVGVTTRSTLRTRRYSFRELQSVELAAATGFPHFGREYLVFNQVDGRSHSFEQLMSRPPKGDSTNSLVRRAAMSIEARLSPAGGRLR
ncbi:MAG: hypothetical protein ABI658_08415 [Acidimicrobiales bacterium]